MSRTTIRWGARKPAAPVAAQAAERRYVLVFEDDTSMMVELPKTGSVVIGRADNCTIVLADRLVSRWHAQIVLTETGAEIADRESANGTWVNGDRITEPRALAHGDVIQLCNTTLCFHSSARARLERPVLDPVALRIRANEEVERAVRYHHALTILVVGFEGNVERAAVELAVRASLRVTDVAGWDADALVVLLYATEHDEATEIARRLLEALGQVSRQPRAGFATCPSDGVDLETLFASARASSRASSAGQVRSAPSASRTLEVGTARVLVADPAMIRLYALAERLAKSELPVLVWGETGTGKEVACGALHHWSARQLNPFVTVNCAAIPETLVESELFGHEKGAFSGAATAKQGLLEAAHGGTVFFDEIGELPLAAQAKLLRVLETRRVMRVGDVRERDVDVRVVAATNRNLKDEVKAGRFRQDLYFRLSGATLWLPPLRDRTGEIPLLAQELLREACVRAKRGPMTIVSSAMHALAAHDWPGNVRELRNLMDYVAATVSDVVLAVEHLTALTDAPAEGAPVAAPPPSAFRPIEQEIRELERARMAAALEAAGGHQKKAAALISMPLRTFVSKLKLYGLRERDA